MKTRTRYACMRFTNDLIPDKKRLPISALIQCECSEDGVQNLPEWAPVYNLSGEQYKCNISNLLEIGSWKAEDRAANGCRDGYYMTSQTGVFYVYVEEKGAFYTVANNLTSKIAAVPLMGKEKTQYAIFGKGKFVMVNVNGSYSTILSKDVVPAGAYFRHRLFFGMKNGVVKYSAPEEFTNFTESVEEGGSVRFSDGGGEIISMKVYDDALYVFFDSGIMRLEVGGDPCEFRAEKIDYTGGDIFTRTICVCDHAIYFMAQSGIYRIKGKKPERLEVGVVLPNKESGLESCAVWKGLPLFRYQQLNGEYKTLAIRADGSAFYMMDLNGLGYGQNGKVLFVNSGKDLYQLAEPGQGTVWINGIFSTVETDFGYSGRKTVRKLRFFGEGEAEVMLGSEGRSVSKKLVFKKGVADWTVAQCGETFAFHFTLGRASKVKGVNVEFQTVTNWKEG